MARLTGTGYVQILKHWHRKTPGMTRVILARHGQTDHNARSLLQGQIDVELNEDGIEEAKKLADHLSDEEIDAVYSSDLERARKTAAMIAAEHRLEPESFAELRERSLGEFEGEPKQIRRDTLDGPDDLDDWKPDDGENLHDLKQRVRPVLDTIREDHTDGTVVVVAHGWVNRSILLSVLGTDSGHGHRIKQQNACLNELEYEDYRGWRIKNVNDTSHLEN